MVDGAAIAAGCRLDPMTDAEYALVMPRALVAYATHKAGVEGTAVDESIRRAQSHQAEMLPRGRETPDHRFFTLRERAGGPLVAWIWLGIQSTPTGRRAYIWDVAVEPAQQGKGLGRAIMTLVEGEVRALGLGKIALHVFGDNARARSLYESLDYVTTSLWMAKDLAPPAAPPAARD